MSQVSKRISDIHKFVYSGELGKKKANSKLKYAFYMFNYTLFNYLFTNIHFHIIAAVTICNSDGDNPYSTL